ncbi:MAG TPA: DUF1573 domain-containing protein [Planctomycetaceae bacterium]|nr:DUF1573 domain-containing protein [Planctomycetaceae bacterium]
MISRRSLLVALGEMLGVTALAVSGGWMARGAMPALDDRPAVFEVDRTEVDFGTVVEGPELTASFVIRNAGSRRLVLRERVACDCLAEGRQVETIPPRESVSVRGRLPTRGRSGPVRRELQFATSDPERPLVTLVLTADVRPGRD